jgi:hypothetical protein
LNGDRFCIQVEIETMSGLGCLPEAGVGGRHLRGRHTGTEAAA